MVSSRPGGTVDSVIAPTRRYRQHITVARLELLKTTMSGILDRAKSKLFGQKAQQKNKDSRCRSSSCSSALPLSGHTFTMRLVRPEMRQLHGDRIRSESDTASTGSSEVDSDVLRHPQLPPVPSCRRRCVPRRETPEMRRRSWCGPDSRVVTVPNEIRIRNSPIHSGSDAVTLRKSAPIPCYRAEVSQSVSLDEHDEVNSEDEDSLVAELERMEAELDKKQMELDGCLKRDSTASGSDGDSGISGIITPARTRSEASDNASSSPHPCDKLEQATRRKTVRFHFQDCDEDDDDEDFSSHDCLSSVSEESSDQEDLDTDEEYLGRI